VKLKKHYSKPIQMHVKCISSLITKKELSMRPAHPARSQYGGGLGPDSSRYLNNVKYLIE